MPSRSFSSSRSTLPNAQTETGSIYGSVTYPSGAAVPNSTEFGFPKQTLNNYLGGGQIGGLNPLYEMGGPRSIQLALERCSECQFGIWSAVVSDSKDPAASHERSAKAV